jgi:hypothetical protein
MFDIRIQYTQKGKTEGVWIVDPEMIRECSGQSLPEALSKFVLEVSQLQQAIHEQEMAALRGGDDDIPF